MQTLSHWSILCSQIKKKPKKYLFAYNYILENIKNNFLNADSYNMKGLERITTVSFAEVLSDSGQIPNEKITEALYQQDSSGSSFVEYLVDVGATTEWDLAKVVVQHFQIPFLMCEYLDINTDALKLFEPEFLFKYKIIPFQKLGSVINILMPTFVPFKILELCKSYTKKEIFPFVGLPSENKRILKREFPDFKFDLDKQIPEAPQINENTWENVFDIGDQEVKRNLDSNK
jgi:hypothetical protein